MKRKCPFVDSLTADTPVLESGDLITDKRVHALHLKLLARPSIIKLIKLTFEELPVLRQGSYANLGLNGFCPNSRTFHFTEDSLVARAAQLLGGYDFTIAVTASMTSSLVSCMSQVLENEDEIRFSMEKLTSELRKIDDQDFLETPASYLYEEVFPGVAMSTRMIELGASLQTAPDRELTMEFAKNTLDFLLATAGTSEFEFAAISRLIFETNLRLKRTYFRLNTQNPSKPSLEITQDGQKEILAFVKRFESTAQHKIRCPALYIQSGMPIQTLHEWSQDVFTFLWDDLLQCIRAH